MRAAVKQTCRYTGKTLKSCKCGDCKSYQIFAGEWVQPKRRGYKMECCDCGLIHRMNFRIKDRHIQFQAFRDK